MVKLASHQIIITYTMKPGERSLSAFVNKGEKEKHFVCSKPTTLSENNVDVILVSKNFMI